MYDGTSTAAVPHTSRPTQNGTSRVARRCAYVTVGAQRCAKVVDCCTHVKAGVRRRVGHCVRVTADARRCVQGGSTLSHVTPGARPRVPCGATLRLRHGQRTTARSAPLARRGRRMAARQRVARRRADVTTGAKRRVKGGPLLSRRHSRRTTARRTVARGGAHITAGACQPIKFASTVIHRCTHVTAGARRARQGWFPAAPTSHRGTTLWVARRCARHGQARRRVTCRSTQSDLDAARTSQPARQRWLERRVTGDQHTAASARRRVK